MFLVVNSIDMLSKIPAIFLRDLTSSEHAILMSLNHDENRSVESFAKESPDSNRRWQDVDAVTASLQFLSRKGLISLIWFEGAPCFATLTRWGRWVVRHGLRFENFGKLEKNSEVRVVYRSTQKAKPKNV